MFNKYPLDFDSLKIGDVITVAQIEKHFSVKLGTDKYAFRLMNLQQAINDKTEFTAKIADGEIHILTWQDASMYNDKSVDHALRKVKRHIRKNVQVKIDGFAPELKATHERRLLKGAFLLEALKDTRKKLVLFDKNGTKEIADKSAVRKIGETVSE